MVHSENGMSARLKAERSAMPVMMPGSAIGRMTSSEIASRPKNFEPDTAAAQSVPSTMAITVAIAATVTESCSAAHTSGRFQVTASHCGGQAGRRPLVALLLGGEGVDEDQQDRQMQEQQPGAGGDLQAERRGLVAIRAHRTPPAAWRPRDRSP